MAYLEHIVEFLEYQAGRKDEIRISMPLLGKDSSLERNGLGDWYCAWISRVPLLEVFDVLEVSSANNRFEYRALECQEHTNDFISRLQMLFKPLGQHTLLQHG